MGSLCPETAGNSTRRRVVVVDMRDQTGIPTFVLFYAVLVSFLLLIAALG